MQPFLRPNCSSDGTSAQGTEARRKSTAGGREVGMSDSAAIGNLLGCSFSLPPSSLLLFAFLAVPYTLHYSFTSPHLCYFDAHTNIVTVSSLPAHQRRIDHISAAKASTRGQFSGPVRSNSESKAEAGRRENSCCAIMCTIGKTNSSAYLSHMR